jgi:hypothetical protein
MTALVPGVKVQAKRRHFRIISGHALETQSHATTGSTRTNRNR